MKTYVRWFGIDGAGDVNESTLSQVSHARSALLINEPTCYLYITLSEWATAFAEEMYSIIANFITKWSKISKTNRHTEMSV